MKHFNRFFTLSSTVLFVPGVVHAVGASPAIMSQYGEIQSVKNYSSNPFWNKNSPYNQNFPKPIYATGADLNTGDCNRVVENLITSYCAEHNYCTNTRISDIRPTIMVQLSQLPGHNFATSCGGYIDSVFKNFQQQYGNTQTVNIPKTTTQTTNITIANPLKQQLTAEQKAVAERAAELERLQSITTPTPTLNATSFPKTTADLSFTDRLANTTAGYEQYKDLNSYKKPNFLGEDEAYFERLKAQNPTEYCKRRPEDTTTCTSQDEHNIIYNGLGADTSICKPEKYETGKGATVTCVPRRTLSTFLGWCTDYATATKFDGKACPKQHTISKTDTEDKTFYAKWKCDKPEYKQTQTACTVSGGSSSGDSDGNSGGNSDGGTVSPTSAPQCLIDVANDAGFKSAVAAKFGAATDLNKWIATNKTTFYTTVADYVVKHCLKDTAEKLMEFNTFLDTSAPLPISVDFNGKTTIVSFDKMELFDYTTYWSYPIVINNNGPKNIGSILNKTDASLPNKKVQCTGNFTDISLVETAIEAGARSAYPSQTPRGGQGYMLARYKFPGLLYNYHQTLTYNYYIVKTQNYALAREQIKKFVDRIISDGECTGNNMVIYLVSEPTPDEDDTKSVKIISEPFIIR